MYKVSDLKLKNIFDDSEKTIRLHVSQKVETDENGVVSVAGSIHKIINESTVFEAYNVKICSSDFDGNLARCVDQRESMLKFVNSGVNPERYDINRIDSYKFMTADEIAAEVKSGNWVAIKGIGLLESDEDLTMIK